MILDIFGDLAGGSTYWDHTTNELVIGQDTLISSGMQITDFVIPSAIADIILNGGGLGYDLAKVSGNTSAFIELRMPFEDEVPVPRNSYFVLYPDAIEGAPVYGDLIQITEALRQVE